MVFLQTFDVSLPLLSSMVRAQLFKSKSECIMCGELNMGMKHRQAINKPETEQRGQVWSRQEEHEAWSWLAWDIST